METDQLLKDLNLPIMEELQKEFGAFTVEEDEDILDLIIEKLRDKVKTYTHLLEDLIHPDTSLISMNEAAAFGEQDALFNLFKELTAYDRQYLLVRLDGTRQDKAEYFRAYFLFWQSKKQQLRAIVSKALDVWKTDAALEKDMTGYFG